MIVSKNHSFIFDLENVKETLGDSLLHGTFLTASYASLAVLGIAFRSGCSSRRRQPSWKICCISELFFC